MEILVDNRQDKMSIDESISNTINKVALECLKLEARDPNVEISISFVDDSMIKKLNNEFRGIDRSTDVLSFPMDDDFPVKGQMPLLGDIVISCETAFRQSKEYGHTFEREIAYLTAHSMFHLLGYDHIEDEEKKIMRGKEKEVMKSLGIFKTNNI